MPNTKSVVHEMTYTFLRNTEVMVRKLRIIEVRAASLRIIEVYVP